jgi:hypothetical protein
MIRSLRGFFQRHPVLRQAALWCVPALVLGAALRLVLLSYLPHAYFGSDSNSYLGFAQRLLTTGDFSLYDKRRYLYLIAMLPVSLLPGSMLQWLAWLQHGMGLLTVIALGYTVRRTCAHWRWVIIPATCVHAGMPMLVWYEHEMLAETLFFNGVVWTMASWAAWTARDGRNGAAAKSGGGFWWFFAGFATLLLTKSAGRFFLPGIVLALVATKAWKNLTRRQWIALGAVCALVPTIGQDKQGAWLLYTSAFPLTRLESPLHAEYKAEIADMVREAQARAAAGETDTSLWKMFLKFPERHGERPLWQKLGGDAALQRRIYKDLAVEGIRTRPFDFLGIAVRKICAAANPDEFDTERFNPAHYLEKYEHHYERDAKKDPAKLHLLWGLKKDAPPPPYAEFSRRIAPRPDAPAARWLKGYADAFQAAAPLVLDDERDPDKDDEEGGIARGPAPAGWWIAAGALLSLLPWWWRTAGVWTVTMAGYLVGVFLVGGANPRFFGPAWPVLILLAALPFDAIFRAVNFLFTKSKRHA